MELGNPSFVPGVGPLDGLLGFAGSLLIGGAAVYVAANYVVYRDNPPDVGFDHAIVTALFGVVAWAVLAWIPLLGIVTRARRLGRDNSLVVSRRLDESGDHRRSSVGDGRRGAGRPRTGRGRYCVGTWDPRRVGSIDS